MGQEYMIRLENELLIERIAKIEKELGIKEKENKDLRIQLETDLKAKYNEND